MRTVDRGDKAHKNRIALAYASDLDAVVIDPDAIRKETLLESLQCPVGDDLLIALRTSFSLTYSLDLGLDNLKVLVTKVREGLAGALQPLADLLVLVKARPLGADKSWERRDDLRVFKFVLAKTKDLQHKVTVEDFNERKALIDLIETRSADELLVAAREIVSWTFGEVYSPLEYRKLLGRIRRRCAEVLIPCNSWLEAIQVEPVATPAMLGYEFLEEDLAQQEAKDTES